MRHLTAAALAVLAIGLFAGCSDHSPTSSDTDSITVPVEHTTSAGVVLMENFAFKQVLPYSNWWNLDISKAPIDTKSSSYIAWINAQDSDGDQRFHPDLAPSPYGIPYIGVSSTQALSKVTFTSYGSESDKGVPGGPEGYPIPESAKYEWDHIENAAPGNTSTSGDRHMLIIDRDRWILFELSKVRWTGSRWEASCGAIFDLKTNYRRPEGWTSTDAAGLAIFPGLVRYDEAYSTEPITHAFRVAVRRSNGHVWPASHTAGETVGAPPLGTRLRLKASKDISGYPAPIRRIFQAMKTYGLIVADNGGNMYVTGTMDDRWDNGILNPAFESLRASDFEVIQLGWGKPGITSGVR
jgi:hypothetical protein